jgi:hypothetical protein
MKITKEAVDVLKGARDILSGFNAWTRGTYARNNKGEDVSLNDPQACRFCADGALRKAAGVNEYTMYPYLSPAYRQAREILEGVMADGFCEEIPDVNDKSTTKHQHVLMSYDLAILQAEDMLKAQQRKAKAKK